MFMLLYGLQHRPAHQPFIMNEFIRLETTNILHYLQACYAFNVFSNLSSLQSVQKPFDVTMETTLVEDLFCSHGPLSSTSLDLT